MKTKPLFDHDCCKCRYIGTYDGKDLYTCSDNGIIDTVISRHSNYDVDYENGLMYNTRVLIPSIANAMLQKKAGV